MLESGRSGRTRGNLTELDLVIDQRDGNSSVASSSESGQRTVRDEPGDVVLQAFKRGPVMRLGKRGLGIRALRFGLLQ